MKSLWLENVPAVAIPQEHPCAPGWWGIIFSLVTALGVWAGIIALQGSADYLFLIFFLLPFKIPEEAGLVILPVFSIPLVSLAMVGMGIGGIVSVIRLKRWQWSVVGRRELVWFLVLVLMSGVAHLAYSAANSIYINDYQTRWQIIAQQWPVTGGIISLLVWLLDGALCVFLVARIIYLIAANARNIKLLARGGRVQLLVGIIVVFSVVSFPGTTDLWFTNRYVDFPLPDSAVLIEQTRIVERDADFAPQIYYASRFTISAADMQALLTAPLWWAVRTDVEHGGDEALSPPVGWQKLSGLGQSQTWINQLEDKGVALGVAPTTDQPHFLIAREKQRTGLGWSWWRLLVANPPTRTIWYYYTVQAAW